MVLMRQKSNKHITLLLCILIVHLSCCRTVNDVIDCDIISEMQVKDQLYRNDTRANPIVFLIDSMSNHDTSLYDQYYDKAIHVLEDRGILSNGRFVRPFWNPNQQKIADSLFHIQNDIDNENSRTVSNWLKNIENNRIDTLPCFGGLFIILAHTDNSGAEEVLKLIESKKKYIHTYSYNYITRVLKAKARE